LTKDIIPTPVEALEEGDVIEWDIHESMRVVRVSEHQYEDGTMFVLVDVEGVRHGGEDQREYEPGTLVYKEPR
jgi:hypothetical protein